MFNSKKGNLIVALIIAIAVWMYVVGEVNPTIERTYNDIPIRLTNQQVMDANGLAVLNVSDETVSVRLKGSRARLDEIDKEDIVVSADLSDVSAGENKLKVHIKVPDNVEITDTSHNKVTVVVEKKTTKVKDVRVHYEGAFDDTEEPETIEQSDDTIEVTGAASEVDQVDYVKASVDAEKVTDNMTTRTATLTPVDKKGHQVTNVTLSKDTVEVTSILERVKTVSLSVPITDDEKTANRTVSVPKTITIKGNSATLNKINSVKAQPIDISDITKKTDIDIIPLLPNGVEVSDKSSGLKVKVTVKALANKEFVFNDKDISFSGVGKDLQEKAEATTITVTVTATDGQLNDITKNDISLSADLSGLAAGNHKVQINAECIKDNGGLSVSPRTIKITLE